MGLGESSIQALGYSGVLKAPPMRPGVEPQKPKLICIEKTPKSLGWGLLFQRISDN